MSQENQKIRLTESERGTALFLTIFCLSLGAGLIFGWVGAGVVLMFAGVYMVYALVIDALLKKKDREKGMENK